MEDVPLETNPPTGEQVAEPSPAQSPPPEPPRPAAREWVELGVVLCIGVFPDILHSFAFIWSGAELPPTFSNEELIGLIIRAFAVTVSVLYFMKYGALTWAQYGLVRPSPWVDPLAGAALLLLQTVLDIYLWGAWNESVLSSPFVESLNQALEQVRSNISRPNMALVGLASTANGVAEELVLRGYFIPTFTRLQGSKGFAVFVGAVLGALYHTYQGGFGTLASLVFGLLAGGFFVWTGRLWPVIVCHVLIDVLWL